VKCVFLHDGVADKTWNRRRNVKLAGVPLCLLILAALFAAVLPASARILSTKPTPTETWNPLLPFTIGGGFEFETDKDQTEFDFPLLIEYNFTEQVKLTVEPTVVLIEPEHKGEHSADGFGDIETSVEWEFLRERRYRPALTAEGIIKWRTATDPDIGDPGNDYALGIIASKDFIFVDSYLGLRYTSVGDPQDHDNFEVTVAGEWPLNRLFAIESESVTTVETGYRGRTHVEGTLGLAWRVTKHLKLEIGGSLKSDGSWQLISAWEWSFAGED
jgi:hypothetical protein